VRLALVVLIACLGSACARVRPHEREHLAHPAMRAPVWPGVDRADQHTFTVREGTGGASGGGGAGCGCN
jgi:hypothetical protein